MVYVLNIDGKPLMPCSSVIARLLLKQGKAKVRRRTPFTIQLLYKTKTEYTQPVTHGLDSGSTKVGSAVSDEKGNVLYISQMEIRNDITDKMKQRSKYRRNRSLTSFGVAQSVLASPPFCRKGQRIQLQNSGRIGARTSQHV